jgi:hypothetical protein
MKISLDDDDDAVILGCNVVYKTRRYIMCWKYIMPDTATSALKMEAECFIESI